jgi:hypothetical protein
MPIRTNPIKISTRLADTLNSHRRISGLLMSFDPNNMSKEDKPILETLNTAARSYLAGNDELMHEWDSAYARFANMIEWGSGSDRDLIAALILAGAAIDRDDVELRPDLSPSLVEARQKYQQAIAAQPSIIWGNIIDTLPMPRPKANFVVKLARNYRIVKANMAPDSRLNVAIKTLLQDDSKSLRVGEDFRTLDIDKLNGERDRRFKERPVGVSTIRPNTNGSGQQYRKMYAPTSLELKAINFDCIKRQEDSTDEIFWVTQFYKVKNLVEVYNQIDDAIKNERWNELDLNIEWERQSWLSGLHNNIDENSDNVPLNHRMGLAEIHYGFCPWVCNMTCVEQDDSEYEAVNEVIDTIDEIAETIGYGASTVATLAGPSPAGAVAGAVAGAASIVSFACDVAGAVVDIVNFFDENDTIGFVDQQGLYDYAGVSAQTTDPFSLEAGKIRGARYLIRTEYTLAGQEQFNRMWRYEQDTVYGPWQHRDPFGFHGGSGDDITTLRFNNPVHSLFAHDVQCNYEAGVRHAEWKAPPQLQNDNLSVRGVVHWGVSWENEIDYRAWVSGLRFLTRV